jgi:predicted phosphoadenosine phosphosulfate sulfurtransferase
MSRKIYQNVSVLEASKRRIAESFDFFERLYISFSGGKDSTVMMHLVCQEARSRGRKVGLLIIDLEAQYSATIKHIENMISEYNDVIDLHWFCGELLLRNAVSDYEPKWICWDENKSELWVREKPEKAADLSQYSFYHPKMEFEELMVIFGKWYSQGKSCGAFIGIRSDESLHRYRAIVSRKNGLMMNDKKWTTRIDHGVYNLYPIYDWRTEDIWLYHAKNKELCYNSIYDLMTRAGVKFSNQRLCQPFGDDQKKGLWLYQILEPDTWYKLLNRVSGVNSGALYSQETGNINGSNKITKPEGYTWQEYTNFLCRSLPKPMQENYRQRFIKFMAGWKKRGYKKIPDYAPHDLEVKQWAPSWRRMCRCILRNDYYCKGLGQTQPLSEAYGKYKDLKKIEKINQLSDTPSFCGD